MDIEQVISLDSFIFRNPHCIIRSETDQIGLLNPGFNF